MPSRNLLVLGATGGTGRQVVAQALQLGHTVTVLARDPTILGLQSVSPDRLRLMTGDMTDDSSRSPPRCRGKMSSSAP
jgi:uncharacterized protein YbjT (DUF2867 family)